MNIPIVYVYIYIILHSYSNYIEDLWYFCPIDSIVLVINNIHSNNPLSVMYTHTNQS